MRYITPEEGEKELQRFRDTNEELYLRLHDELQHFFGEFVELTNARSWYLDTSDNDPIINVTGVLKDIKLGDSGIIIQLSATSDEKSALSEYGNYWWYTPTRESCISVIRSLDPRDKRELIEVSVIIKGFFKILQRIDDLDDRIHS